MWLHVSTLYSEKEIPYFMFSPQRILCFEAKFAIQVCLYLSNVLFKGLIVWRWLLCIMMLIPNNIFLIGLRDWCLHAKTKFYKPNCCLPWFLIWYSSCNRWSWLISENEFWSALRLDRASRDLVRCNQYRRSLSQLGTRASNSSDCCFHCLHKIK